MFHGRELSFISREHSLGCILVVVMIVSGCSVARTPTLSGTRQQSREDKQEALSALHSVTKAVSGKDLTQDQMIDLARNMEKDQETQSAVKAITDSLQGTSTSYKYCPICGKRYHPKFRYCPIHGVPLKTVNE